METRQLVPTQRYGRGCRTTARTFLNSLHRLRIVGGAGRPPKMGVKIGDIANRLDAVGRWRGLLLRQPSPTITVCRSLFLLKPSWDSLGIKLSLHHKGPGSRKFTDTHQLKWDFSRSNIVGQCLGSINVEILSISTSLFPILLSSEQPCEQYLKPVRSCWTDA